MFRLFQSVPVVEAPFCPLLSVVYSTQVLSAWSPLFLGKTNQMSNEV